MEGVKFPTTTENSIEVSESENTTEKQIYDNLRLVRNYFIDRSHIPYDSHSPIHIVRDQDHLTVMDDNFNELIKFNSFRKGFNPRTRTPISFSKVAIGFPGDKESTRLDLHFEEDGLRSHANIVTKNKGKGPQLKREKEHSE